MPDPRSSKCVFILGKVPPPFGGVSVFVKRRLDRLRIEGYRCEHVDASRTWRVLLGLLKCRLTRTAKIEVNTLRLPALFFVALTGNLGRAIIVDHNHSRHFERYSKLKRLLTGLLLSRVRRLELVGEHLVDHYKKSGIPLPNAVEFISPFIEPVEEDAARLMAAYPPGLLKFLDNRHPVLLTSVWRLSADIDGGVYGVGHCLALLARLTLRFPSIGLIVAIGDAHDKEYVATVVKASAAMGLKDNTFVASNIGELWPLMRRSDLFLRLTNTDGASVSLREALHFGCPIIATDVVPRPEGVMLVHYGDVDGMEHAAIKSLAGTGRRARNGEI